eukprot:TRINITY_DN2052_c0_g2_i4.p2 TRINITY_DN2052_c0_g2~~TRINITY_DN2052_c0_g2_i4.p2  ORF type:complete len:271 (-),score=-14.31 TRINITY_DN2052_c0_g2_i4:111-923(-)
MEISQHLTDSVVTDGKYLWCLFFYTCIVFLQFFALFRAQNSLNIILVLFFYNNLHKNLEIVLYDCTCNQYLMRQFTIKSTYFFNCKKIVLFLTTQSGCSLIPIILLLSTWLSIVVFVVILCIQSCKKYKLNQVGIVKAAGYNFSCQNYVISKQTTLPQFNSKHILSKSVAYLVEFLQNLTLSNIVLMNVVKFCISKKLWLQLCNIFRREQQKYIRQKCFVSKQVAKLVKNIIPRNLCQGDHIQLLIAKLNTILQQTRCVPQVDPSKTYIS